MSRELVEPLLLNLQRLSVDALTRSESPPSPATSTSTLTTMTAVKHSFNDHGDHQSAGANASAANLRWLQAYATSTGRQLECINGQRSIGPTPDMAVVHPQNGSEVFVGHLPPDAFEAELVPLFSRVGPIYCMRLMLHFTGINRGYCFVRYTRRDDALAAIRKLNNHYIRPHVRIGVVASRDSRQLCVRGLAEHVNAADVAIVFKAMTSGVADVAVDVERKMAIVEYDSHRDAAVARRRLIPLTDELRICGARIDSLDWVQPELNVCNEAMSKLPVLFVRNLPPHTDDDRIRRYFTSLLTVRYGGVCVADALITRIRRMGDKDYAFVHFVSCGVAETAIEMAMQTPRLDGHVIIVEWSRPIGPRCTEKWRHNHHYHYFNSNNPRRPSFMYEIPNLNHHSPRVSSHQSDASTVATSSPPAMVANLADGCLQPRQLVSRLLGTVNRCHWDN